MQRRQFLRGAGGVFFGLPFLEGLLDSKAQAAGAEPLPFAIFMHQGNGVEDKRWWPKTPGLITDDSLKGTAMEGLTAYKSKILALKGIAIPYQDGESGMKCGHAYACAQILTGATPNWSASAKSRTTSSGTSIDWEIARYFKGEPLNLISAAEGGPIHDMMSYKGDGQKNPTQKNPFEAYKKIFGMVDANADTSALENRALLHKSVNDLVKQQMEELLKNPRLSKADKVRLEAHRDNIRLVEKNMGVMNFSMGEGELKRINQTKGFDQNNGAYGNVPNIAKMHLDIIALAAATGQIRAANMQFGQGFDLSRYDVGSNDDYHTISHHSNKGAGVEFHHRIDKVVMDNFKYLLDRLSSYDMGGGKTILDYGVAVLLNALTNTYHDVVNLPHVYAGSCNGKLLTGRFVVSNQQIINNRFLSTIGAAVGMKNADGSPFDGLNATKDNQRGEVKEIVIT